jgi:hypothetical protein
VIDDAPARDDDGKAGLRRAILPADALRRTAPRAPVTIPDDAPLPLVLDTAISSASSRSGDLVLARIAGDVIVGDRVAVRTGTEFRGLVTEAVPAGVVKGIARLGFDFDALVFEGKEHSIGSRPIEIAAVARQGSDAAVIGISVGADPIVDVKRRAIGALIGATGTGVVLTNQGKDVELHKGTRITVRLIREARL